MTADLAVTALHAAIARRQPDGIVIVHADRGAQFRARSFRAVLAAARLQGSMGRVASAGGNAAMESFCAPLQRNILDSQQWRTREDSHHAMCSGSSTPITDATGSRHSEPRRAKRRTTADPWNHAPALSSTARASAPGHQNARQHPPPQSPPPPKSPPPPSKPEKPEKFIRDSHERLLLTPDGIVGGSSFMVGGSCTLP